MNNRADANGDFDFTATQIQFALEAALQDFIADHLTLTARFGYHMGENIVNNDGDDSLNVDGGDAANNPVWGSYDPANTGFTQTTMGYEIGIDYWGLNIKYGAFDRDLGDGSADALSAASRFSVGYKVTF